MSRRNDPAERRTLLELNNGALRPGKHLPAALRGPAPGASAAPAPAFAAGRELARREEPAAPEATGSGGAPGATTGAGGPREPVSDPGSWDRFCARAAQRWPLVLGAATLLAVPGALLGHTRGEELHAAEARVELLPRALADREEPGGGAPAEALGVAELVQREAGLLEDVGADLGVPVLVTGRPPYGLVAEVRDPDPAAARAAAGGLLAAYRQRTRLPGAEQAALRRAEAAELDAQLLERRDELTRVNIDIGRAEQRLERAGDAAALAAAERDAQGRRSAAQERLAEARATGRDPLVFLPTLLREAPAAADAAAGLADAAGDAAGAAFRGRALGPVLRDVAAAAAALVAAVEDHRLVTDGGLQPRLVSLPALGAEAEEAAAAARAATAAAEVARVQRSALESLRWERERVLGETEKGLRALESLQRGSPAAASLADASLAPPAAAPVADTRPAQALLGGLLGALLGALGALAWVASDDRVRRGDERPWAARGLAVLGTVPEVGGGEADDRGAPSEASMRRAQGDAAALAEAVHAVRAMLEGRAARAGVGADAPGGRTFAVTSSGPGSGKTGLCLGLAASLASAGERVLLVDAAWADRAPGVGGPAAPGDAAPPDRQTLEAAAARMGYLHPEDADLLEHPDPDEPVGLPAFLSGTGLEEASLATRIPGLSLLPAGPGPLDAARLSGRHVRRLVDAARPLHDVTLIDTSALSAGLDGLFVSAAADGVLLVVSAGERQGVVDRTVARLRASGAEVLGTVLNRVGRPRPATAAGRGGAPAALESGWQDQGSGMFAAAMGTTSTGGEAGGTGGAGGEAGGGARRVRSATPGRAAADPVGATGGEAAASAPAPEASEAVATAPEPPADEAELDVADVLAAVHAGEPAAAPDADAAGTEEDPDLDELTAELAERIASDATADAAGSAGDADNADDERSPDAGDDPDAWATPARSAPGDAALDRLVDRHINASLPGREPLNGRRLGGDAPHRG